MWKLRSDKGFLGFLSSESTALTPALIIILGIVLIFISGPRQGADYEASEGREEMAEELCSMIDGVGECRVLMTYREGGEEVYAVAVLCEGAESVYVRERLTSLFTSLYGIGSNRVEIQRLNKK